MLGFWSNGVCGQIMQTSGIWELSYTSGSGATLARRTTPTQANLQQVSQKPRQDLIGKTVVVVGLGVSGRAAAKLALARGASVIGVDNNAHLLPLEMDPGFGGQDLSRLKTELGPHQRKTFFEASKLVVSPGVPVSQPIVSDAIKNGVPAVSELGFATEVFPRSIKIVAVTGTNGKSTVVTFTGQILSQAGIQTFVGGNLGTPLSEASLQCLSFPVDDPPFNAAVVEVSSYQMELSGSFNPLVAAVLNLTEDHLERHKTMESYGMMKCRLFSGMGPLNTSAIPYSDSFLRKLAFQSGGKGSRAWLGGLPGVQLDSQAERAIVVVPTTGAEVCLNLNSVNCIGLHNRHNAGTAALLALALDVGLEQDGLQRALSTLQLPPHRMQLVCEDKRGVRWINDSKATNVAATYTGLKGFAGCKSVVLLGGLAKVGSEENLGFGQLVEVLGSHIAVIVFGASREKIVEELHAAGLKIPCISVESMANAIDVAKSTAQRGDTILLTPACASFDEFSNFEHRGQVFSSLAKA
ncbi:hypothetical protein O6H91_03G003600 [Diphasiastrum complanatum]|uniref:Uncharacterized protein n=1 Tax=Diphasiastrum complanatum TaxID=34168 RepID=A0ACC2E353_DIPCM|nr:hypothetical protein O6H91_03G003600 [Diphasiastrum complanatum]